MNRQLKRSTSDLDLFFYGFCVNKKLVIVAVLLAAVYAGD